MPTYYQLTIIATKDDTEIWLGDTAGFLVTRSTGTLSASLLPGEYLVEFTLGSPCHPVSLTKDITVTEQDVLSQNNSRERPSVEAFLSKDKG